MDRDGEKARTVAFAAPASRNSNPRGAARSVKMTENELADYVAYLKKRAEAQDDPPMYLDMVANTGARFGRQVKEEEEEEL